MMIRAILIFAISSAGFASDQLDPDSGRVRINEIVTLGGPDTLLGALYRGWQFGAFVGAGFDICAEHGLGASFNSNLDWVIEKSPGLSYLQGAQLRFLWGMEKGRSFSAAAGHGIKFSAFPGIFFQPYFQFDAGLNLYYGLDWYSYWDARPWRIGPRLGAGTGFDIILNGLRAPGRWTISIGVKGAVASDFFSLISRDFSLVFMDFSILPEIRLALTRPFLKGLPQTPSAGSRRHSVTAMFGCFAINVYQSAAPDGFWDGFEYRYLLVSGEWFSGSPVVGIQGHSGFAKDDPNTPVQRMYGYYAGFRMAGFQQSPMRPYWEGGLGKNVFIRAPSYDREKFTIWLGAGGEWLIPGNRIQVQAGLRFDPLEWGGLMYQLGIGYRL